MTLPRIGLGCMRLSTELDEAAGRAVIHAALDAGVTLFDTATAYCRTDALGENERLLKTALLSHPRGGAAVIVTKGGLRRPNGAWRPDGRARSIIEDAERSLEALGRVPDVFLLHAPDPSVPWKTSVRALLTVLERGLARSIGLSNVSVGQLDEALALAPITVVQQGVSIFDDRARRSGVLSRAFERGLEVMAYAPLGGPKRAARLATDSTLSSFAATKRVSHGAIALAAVLDLDPRVSVIPGARRAETIVDALTAAGVSLDEAERAQLRDRFPALGAPVAAEPSPSGSRAEIVLLMGIQGAGKSQLVNEYLDNGFLRFNRDELGGTLKDVAAAMARAVTAGATHVVLDNTYTTRASRSTVLETAQRLGAKVRGVWLDVPLHEAQVNVVLRMLAAHGRLLEPAELKAQKDNTGLSPIAHFRTVRELEAPTREEGFDRLELRPFVRMPTSGRAGARFISLERATDFDATPAPTFVFAWTETERAHVEAHAKRLGGHALVCSHGGGPPSCWCRPPLPGLILEACHQHGLSVQAATVFGASEAHHLMAASVAAQYG